MKGKNEMSKLKLVLEIADNLKQLSDSVEFLVNSIRNDEKIPVSVETTKAESPMEEIITIEEVRALLANKSQSGKQPQVKALITKYGASRLTEIDPSKFREILMEAEAL